MVKHVRIPNELRGELLRLDEPFGDEEDDFAPDPDDGLPLGTLSSGCADAEQRCQPRSSRAAFPDTDWNTDATSRGRERTSPSEMD